MKIDARPFLTVTGRDGQTAKCRVKYTPLTDAIGSALVGVRNVRDDRTHVITVFDAFEVAENDKVSVDGETYRVLRNGIERRPLLKLHVSRETPRVAP